MTRAFTPNLEILPEAQRRVWLKLGPTRDLGYVLYGGTAIAIQLGHRSSIDFDFFSDRPLDAEILRSRMPMLSASIVLQEQPNTLSVQMPSEIDRDEFVNMSFFGGLSIGRVGDPAESDDNLIQVASLEDLLATKVKVILQRVESKDYLDIAELLNAGTDLAIGLSAARQMYGLTFQPSECLKAMAYFEGGDLHLLPERTKETLVHAVAAVHELPSVELLSRSLSA
jgi:hypothetical protein